MKKNQETRFDRIIDYRKAEPPKDFSRLMEEELTKSFLTGAIVGMVVACGIFLILGGWA